MPSAPEFQCPKCLGTFASALDLEYHSFRHMDLEKLRQRTPQKLSADDKRFLAASGIQSPEEDM